MPNSISLTLAALGLSIASSSVAQPPSTPVVVNIWSFGFAPSPIRLVAGRPVTLTFVNRSGGGHDFTSRGFFAASRVLAGDARNGRVELRGRESKAVTLVPARGNYEAHCSHLFHTQMGMSDAIVVE